MILTSIAAIHQTVHDRLDRKRCICVFPTETAAKFWADEYVRTGDSKVLRLDRVMAWDKFRAMFLPTMQKRPSNAMIRQLFSIGFLAQSRNRDSLEWYRCPSFPESSDMLAKVVARLLPRINELERLKTEHPESFSRLPKAFQSDLHLIHVAYKEFLEAHDLYEPQFLRPSREHLHGRPNDTRYTIFFPGVCSGWDEFSHMQNFPDWIEPISIDATDRKVSIDWYGNESMELKACFDSIERLLDAGIGWDGLMVTIGNVDRWTPRLVHEASLRGIPLNIVDGRSILSYAPGRFLQLLQDLYTHRFSLEVMKSLLLDPKFPISGKSSLRQLIRKGIESSVTMGSTHAKDDGWELSLSRSTSIEDRTLLQWYRTFKAMVVSVVESSTVDQLVKSLFALQHHLFIEQTWNDSDADVYAFCIDFLTHMKSSLTDCGLDGVPRLYSLFLQFLGQLKYIPKQRQVGIPVYSYKVSVGICPEHHFLLGCTEEDTRIERERFPLIPEPIWDEDEEDGTTQHFIDHYRLGGKHVHWTGSQAGYGGVSSLAPSWFMDHDAIRIATYTPNDSIRLEQRVWNGVQSSPWKPTLLQTNWFRYASTTAFVPPRFDLADRDPTFGVWDRMRNEEGYLKISSTSIDAFASCPMQWVAKYLFQLEKGTYGNDPIDNRQVGIVLHRILEKFFRAVKTLSRVYRRDLQVRYAHLLYDVIEAEFNDYAQAPDAPSYTTMQYIRTRYTQKLQSILTTEAAVFDGFESMEFEKKLEHRYPDRSHILHGRIDRISKHVDDNGTIRMAVVDYKKNFTARISDYTRVEDAIPSYQMPLYARLLHDEAQDMQVDIAAYYDIEKGTYRVIWDEANRQRRDAMVSLLEKRIAEMTEALQGGTFGTTASNEPCKRCDFRQICRRRYALV